MTALNFVLMEEFIIISMDTLAVLQDTKTPFKFVSKFCHLPQMNCVICGTGDMSAIVRWIAYVQENIVANGIYQLDLLTQSIFPTFMRNEIAHEDASTTLYQFGLSELDNAFYGYAYRTIDNYKSEQLEYGLGLKPQDAFHKDGALDPKEAHFDLHDCENSLINIMERQKQYDDDLPTSEKVGIGGYIQMIFLTKDQTITKTLKVFDDLGKQYQTILEACSKS